jgi:hypothetical protein
MKYFIACLLAATLAAGCSTTGSNPGVTKAIVTTTVATAVALGVEKSPESVPYLRAAAPIICSAAAGTNLSPVAVITALENSPATQFKTVQATIIINGALSLYTVLYEQYGADYVKNHAQLQSWLQGTCDGLLLGLPLSGLAQPRTVSNVPHVR